MKINGHSVEYRADVDGLRALAIILVVLHHVFPRHLKGGFVGVDVFFVISGYLITGVILKGLECSRFDFLSFYSGRIRRLFPSLLLVIVFSIFIGWIVLLKNEFSELGKHVLGGIGGVANLVYWSEFGYFDVSSAKKPLLHLWSLAVECQFYLFWPFVICLAVKVRRLIFVVSVFVLLSFVMSVFLCDVDPVAGYYFTLSRAWELGVGGLLIVLPKQRPNWWGISGLIGIVMILLSALCFSKYNVFPGYLALVPVVGAALVIDAGVYPRSNWCVQNILTHDGVVMIGNISYPLYLWHWVLLSFLSILKCGDSLAWQRVLAAGFSVVLAWLTWRFWERKIRYRHSGYVVIWLCAGSVLLMLAGCMAWLNKIPVRNSNLESESVILAVSDWEYPPRGFVAEIENGVEIVRGGMGDKCVVFLGDSHVQQYASRISELIKMNSGYSVTFVTLGGCPPIPIKLARDPSHCADVLEVGLREAAKKNVVAVVVGGYWNGYFDPDRPDKSQFAFGDAGKDMSDLSQREIAIDALEGMLSRISKNRRAILILDNPTDAVFNPRAGVSSGGRLLWNYAVVERIDSVRIASWQIELKKKMRASALRANAEAIDPSEYLCRGDTCRGITPLGDPFYKDEHHLRSSQVRRFGSWIDTVMRSVEVRH